MVTDGIIAERLGLTRRSEAVLQWVRWSRQEFPAENQSTAAGDAGSNREGHESESERMNDIDHQDRNLQTELHYLT